MTGVMPRVGRIVVVMSALVVVALPLAGCSSSSGASSAKTVQVRLVEFQLTPNAADVKAGTLGFDVRNAGTTKHEMVVVRAGSADELPKRADGSVDEDKIAPTDKAGETGEFDASRTKSVSLDLRPGSYVMFCNIVQDTAAGPVSHFARGMHAQISVT